jgi:uronate dehydrogenase
VSRVVITGSKGTIGSVLYEGLREQHQVTGLELPEGDISKYDFLLSQLHGANTVIHVAYSANPSTREGVLTGSINPTNIQLEMNVLTAVIEAGVKRLILASSVHADNFTDHQGAGLLTVPGSYNPPSAYGTHKLILEEVGRFYASHFHLEFVGVRFGGVTRDNSVRPQASEPAVWLSHRDLVNAIEACVSAELVPNRFAVFYAVSDNDGRIHSTENPFGWQPLDNSRDA